MFYASRGVRLLALLLMAVACDAAEEAAAPEFEVRDYAVADVLAELRDSNAGEQPLAVLRSLSIAAGASTDVSVRRVSDRGEWRLRLTAEQHAAFEDLLDGLRRGGTQQVVLSAWWLDLESLKTLDHIDLSGAVRFPADDAFPAALDMTAVRGDAGASSTVTSYQPYLTAVLREEESVELLDRAQRDEDASVFSTPKITFWNGQRGSVYDLSQRPFVVGIDKVVGKLGEANRPVIAVLNEGRTLGVRAVALKQGGVELKLRLAEAHLAGVEEIAVPGERGVTIQAPRLAKNEITAEQLLRDGESLLLAPSVQPDKKTGRIRCCLVRAEGIKPTTVAQSSLLPSRTLASH